MIKDWALTKRAQYQQVYQFGGMWGSRLLVIRVLANGLEFSRYGFSVSKNVGNAVKRNRVRRLLKEIVRVTPIRSGWDIVFIAHPSAVDVSYHELGKSVVRLLFRAGLLLDKNEVVNTGVN